MVHDQLTRPDGAERYVRAIAATLAQQGYECPILTATGQAERWSAGAVYTIDASEGWRTGRRNLRKLLSILDADDPDLVYIHNTKWFLSPLLVDALIRRIPSVLFVHDVRLICPNQTKIVRSTQALCGRAVGIRCLQGGCCRMGSQSMRHALKDWGTVRWRLAVCRNVNRVIAPSRYVARELLRNGFSPAKVVHLPHFTERKADEAAPASRAGLLWIGRFDDAKGFEFFAHALARLRNVRWHAAVVGDGPYFSEARRLMDRLGLAPRVSFLGTLSDGELDVWYAWTRVVVVTSMLAEAFCLVGIEAMAHGRPVVAFDAAGIWEWLGDGTTGFVVPRGDVDRLGAALQRMLTDTNLAEHLGRSGQALVDRRFRRPQHLESLLATFNDARRDWDASQFRGHEVTSESR